MKNTVNWFEIYAADFNRAKQFYTTVFEVELTAIPMHSERHAHMDYAVFPGNEEGSGSMGALVKLDKVNPGPGGTLIYFDTKEINTELSRVTAAGGKILQPKVNIGEAGFIALIEDTEGNIIGLRSKQ
ncbi:VOC family protein [Chitinophaga qingshengii]|uniref:VOC family protein n=1 Tax=Chitinophaga qingshengii TaxID=1569794 RepID=A0ABR7TLX1_9BACT|nr:VOC family protein [Chitinophaga qingshengii]MBC9931487.1 VOC family protein [Chitinophaga qingshengii]